MSETPERASDPAQWVNTIRFTLADIVARGEWDDFGLFRILNRISFACRYHLMFVVAFRTADASARTPARYRASPVISSLDPVFFNLIFDHLYKTGLTNQKFSLSDFEKNPNRIIQLNEIRAPEYAIDIWGTGVCVLAFILHVSKSEAAVQPAMKLDPVAVSSALGSFIAEVLKPFDGARATSPEYPDMLWSDRMHIPRHAAYSGLGELRNANTLKRAEGDIPVPLSEPDRELIRGALDDVGSLVEDEYGRLAKSPLLNNDLSCSNRYRPITNALFIGKVFDAEAVRYGHYRYNARAILPETRVAAIESALASAVREDFIPFDHGAADNDFWNCAASGTGRKRIIQNLKQAVPSYVRLFAESVLMSGTTLIKPGVFARSAIGWIDGKVSLSRAERHKAFFLLCCFHFVLQLGAPVRPVDAEELSIVALPFRCSGGIWMCGVYVRDNPQGPIPELVDQQRFEESALIYHSLFRESERRLRRRARGRYIDALGKLIAEQTVSTSRRGKEDENLLCLDAVSREEYQRGMRLLTRVYPFDGVELVPWGDADEDAIRFDQIAFRSVPNAFFDRLTLHDFVDEKDNTKRLKERIMLASVLTGEADG